MKKTRHLLKSLGLITALFILGISFAALGGPSDTFVCSAWAEDAHTDHCVCGAAHKEIGSHKNAESHTWTGISDLSQANENGYYYLTDNITLDSTWTPEFGVVLCLNGKTITADGDFNAIQVAPGRLFTITDCKDSGRITHTSGKKGCGIQSGDQGQSAPEVHMYGGTISGNTEPDPPAIGFYTFAGGVINYGKFNMYGGSISKNNGEGAGGVLTHSSFNMYGGEITENSGRDSGGVYNKSAFHMYGGSITKNNADTGGGVRNEDWFTMSSGSITDNTGGGVHNIKGKYTYGRIEISSRPVISNNTINGKATNIYTNTPITVAGSLTAGTKVGMTAVDMTTGAAIAETNDQTALGQNDISYFSSDDPDEFTLEQIGSEKIVVHMAHKHTLCNKSEHTGEGHSGSCSETLRFSAWNNEKALPSEAGNYVLERDVTLDSQAQISENISLCLNGHTITGPDSGDTAITVQDGKTLKITDCQGNGKISKGSAADQRGVTVETGAAFELYGGVIRGFKTNGNGGGVYVKGTFDLYNDGAVWYNTSAANGGGIYVDKNGTFTMNRPSADLNEDHMPMHHNKASMGGGVYNNGTFKMVCGNIENNSVTAATGGGGVYNNGNLSITGNSDIRGNYYTSSTAGILCDLVTAKSFKAGNVLTSGKRYQYIGLELAADSFEPGDTVIEGTDGNDLTQNDLSKFTMHNPGATSLVLENGRAVLKTTVDIPDSVSYTYDGTMKSFPADDGYTVTGDSEKTAAGSYNAVLELKNKNNCVWSDRTAENKTVTWTITPKELTADDLTITYPSEDELVYDGQPKSITAAPKGTSERIEYTISYGYDDDKQTDSPTDVREYTPALKISENQNYKGTITLDKMTITPRPVSITADAKEKYVGEDDPVFTGKVIGLLKDQTDADLGIRYQRKSGDENKQSAGDDITITAVHDDDSNYKFTVADSKLTIRRYSQTLTFDKKSRELIYKPDLTFTQTVSGAETDVTYTSSDTDIAAVDQDGRVTVLKAGTVIITATAQRTEKYEESSDSYTLTVKKADPAIPADLTGTQYKKLSSVTLPDGWAWDDPDTEMDQDGSQSFPARYTPAGAAAEKYNPVTAYLTVQVAHTHRYTEQKIDKALKDPATCTENAVYYKSCSCGELSEETFEADGTAQGHDFAGGTWQNVDNGTKHAKKCSRCDQLDTAEAHTGGTATCSDKAVCEVCSASYGAPDPQNHSGLKHVAAKKATGDSEGNIEYWYCEDCGKYFSDAEAAEEITEEDTIIAKLPDDKPKDDPADRPDDNAKDKPEGASDGAATGDPADMVLWLALLLISGAALTCIVMVRRTR